MADKKSCSLPLEFLCHIHLDNKMLKVNLADDLENYETRAILGSGSDIIILYGHAYKKLIDRAYIERINCEEVPIRELKYRLEGENKK